MLTVINKKWYFIPIITIISAILVFQPIVANANQQKVEKKESEESSESLTAGAVFLAAVTGGSWGGFSYIIQQKTKEEDFVKSDFIRAVALGACFGVANLLLPIFGFTRIAAALNIYQTASNVSKASIIADALIDRLYNYFRDSLSRSGVNDTEDSINNSLNRNKEQFDSVMLPLLGEFKNRNEFIRVGSRYSGSISPSGDIDLYSFVANRGYHYTIETFGSTDMYMYLIDTDGSTEIKRNDDGGSGTNSKIKWTCEDTGKYYISLRHFSNGTGNYQVSVTRTTNGEEVTLSTDGNRKSASISPAGDIDWYKFIASSGKYYTIETFGSTDMYMYLMDTNKSTVIQRNDDGGSGTNSKIAWSCNRSGIYYIKLRHYSSRRTGNYQVSVTIPPVRNREIIQTNGT